MSFDIPRPYVALTPCRTAAMYDGKVWSITRPKSSTSSPLNTFESAVRVTTGAHPATIWGKYDNYLNGQISDEEQLRELQRDIENYNLACHVFFQAIAEEWLN